MDWLPDVSEAEGASMPVKSSSMAITSNCDRLSLSWPSHEVILAGTLQGD